MALAENKIPCDFPLVMTRRQSKIQPRRNANKVPEPVLAWDDTLGQERVVDTEQQAFIADHAVHINKPVTVERDREDFMRDPVGFFHECEQYRTLGSGCYGVAVATRDGNVVKRFSIRDGYGCWISYCAYAYRRGHGNANIPRVYAIALPDNMDTSEYGYVLMERLDADEKKHDYSFADRMCTLFYTIHNGNPVNTKTLSPVERLWADFCVQLNRKSVSIGVDVHWGNILHRGNTSVVVDPACTSGNSTAAGEYLACQQEFCAMAAVFDPRFYVQMSKEVIIKTVVM